MVFACWILITLVFAYLGHGLFSDLRDQPAFLFQAIVLEFCLFIGYCIMMVGPLAALSWIIPCQICGHRNIDAYEYCTCDGKSMLGVTTLRTMMWPWLKSTKPEETI